MDANMLVELRLRAEMKESFRNAAKEMVDNLENTCRFTADDVGLKHQPENFLKMKELYRKRE